MPITQERLKHLLYYDHRTGVFTRRVSLGGGAKVGDVASCFNKATGYEQVRVDGAVLYAHRAAFLYMTGEVPKCVDHINLDRADNRFENLREATQALNCANTKVRKHSQVGLKGVSLSNRGKPYFARIRGKHLGQFDSAREAHLAYCAEAVKQYGKFANFG